MASSLAAFYEKIPIGHVEAGLRTNNKRDPFPEELNRRLISQIGSLHFAPTDQSKVTLIVRGSIDLSYGGRICHRHGGPNAGCGSGKPENLAIIFQQPSQNKISKQRLFCSPNGGIGYKKDPNRNISSIHPNNIPFNTINKFSMVKLLSHGYSGYNFFLINF